MPFSFRLYITFKANFFCQPCQCFQNLHFELLWLIRKNLSDQADGSNSLWSILFSSFFKPSVFDLNPSSGILKEYPKFDQYSRKNDYGYTFVVTNVDPTAVQIFLNTIQTIFFKYVGFLDTFCISYSHLSDKDLWRYRNMCGFQSNPVLPPYKPPFFKPLECFNSSRYLLLDINVHGLKLEQKNLAVEFLFFEDNELSFFESQFFFKIIHNSKFYPLIVRSRIGDLVGEYRKRYSIYLDTTDKILFSEFKKSIDDYVPNRALYFRSFSMKYSHCSEEQAFFTTTKTKK